MSTLPLLLVVDDSSTIRTTVKSYLRGFEGQLEIAFAVNGFDAVRAVSTGNPSLVLADVLMPRMSGYQLCQMIKQSPTHRTTPVYILSSKDGDVDKALGMQCGADGYLVKPFSKPSLTELVATVLHLSAAEIAA